MSSAVALDLHPQHERLINGFCEGLAQQNQGEYYVVSGEFPFKGDDGSGIKRLSLLASTRPLVQSCARQSSSPTSVIMNSSRMRRRCEVGRVFTALTVRRGVVQFSVYDAKKNKSLADIHRFELDLVSRVCSLTLACALLAS